ncbi:hypothetical protein J3Q64DRAFT_1673103 [Phycomyces blakesleeanus]|uniref:Uncharacterized protein n=1 Tax=Phycomyces blakesleeanus TaxID=4837 RepID=A0ABR3BAN4_PHYBL
MSTVLSHSESVMPLETPSSYKEIIKQLAAELPKPYGAIPPLMKKRRKKKNREQTMRRMSHVEDWIVVDSKESLPDEEELVSNSPFRNFLSADFFTQVLPLHMPPPSLSDPGTLEDDEEDEEPASSIIPEQGKGQRLELGQESGSEPATASPDWKSDGEEETAIVLPKELVRRHSISSFSKALLPSTSTTASSVMSSSPPQADGHRARWMETITQLRRSLVQSATPKTKTKKKKTLIPMPLPPRRPSSHRRRSEATTQPRFNPDTNTYTRDTRSNPDHLRMISAELNMMRARKLLSPLKPRGFLPRRKDPFVRGLDRSRSGLRSEL